MQYLLYHNSNEVSNIIMKAIQDVHNYLKKVISFNSIVFLRFLLFAFFVFILLAPSGILILNLSLANTMEQYFAITQITIEKLVQQWISQEDR